MMHMLFHWLPACARLIKLEELVFPAATISWRLLCQLKIAFLRLEERPQEFGHSEVQIVYLIPPKGRILEI